MTVPALRLITTPAPRDDNPADFLDLPEPTTAQPGAAGGGAPARAGTGTPDGAPPIDFAGTIRVRRTIGEVLATVAPAFVPPAAAATGWFASGGNPTVMMGVGCGVGVAVMVWDRRRTRCNRWSTTARPPQGGRRRTDEERLRDMAATAAPAGTIHRG